jgi:hypothetical protein
VLQPQEAEGVEEHLLREEGEVVVRQLQEEEEVVVVVVVVHLLLEVAEAAAEGRSLLVLEEVEGEGLEDQNWLVEEAAVEVEYLKLDAVEEHGPQVVVEAEAAEQRLPKEVVE